MFSSNGKRFFWFCFVFYENHSPEKHEKLLEVVFGPFSNIFWDFNRVLFLWFWKGKNDIFLKSQKTCFFSKNRQKQAITVFYIIIDGIGMNFLSFARFWKFSIFDHFSNCMKKIENSRKSKVLKNAQKCSKIAQNCFWRPQICYEHVREKFQCDFSKKSPLF